jgi:hypothetical protein
LELEREKEEKLNAERQLLLEQIAIENERSRIESSTKKNTNKDLSEDEEDGNNMYYSLSIGPRKREGEKSLLKMNDLVSFFQIYTF